MAKQIVTGENSRQSILRGVNSLADAAIDQERQLLNLTVADLFARDLRPYSKAVNDGVTGFQLTQEEFDALVSFTFNVGITAFQGSDLLKKLNENQFRDGEADDREHPSRQGGDNDEQYDEREQHDSRKTGRVLKHLCHGLRAGVIGRQLLAQEFREALLIGNRDHGNGSQNANQKE